MSIARVITAGTDATNPTADETLLNALLDVIPEYLCFKDRDSRYLAVSRSYMRALGRTSPDEFRGRTDADFFSPERAQRCRAAEQAVLDSGLATTNQLEHETWPGGGEVWLLTSRIPVTDASGQVVGTAVFSRDVTEKKCRERELERTHREVTESSRTAGMAEVATGVLHNVGNVLNSLNVSASVLATGLRQSKAESLSRIAALLREHEGDLAGFLSTDPKGRRVPEFLSSLAQHCVDERDRLLQELGGLQKNIDHIKEIVAMQQAYATMIGVVEALDPVAMMEDALRMNAGALERHEVRIEREYRPATWVLGEQAKILQILVNLIRNAKYACDEGAGTPKQILLGIRQTDTGRVQLIVRDNGVGIRPENMARIFQHGFTTRAKGHGFGLHSSANAAREMRGTLTAQSDGPGRGATFTLELPAAPPPGSS